MRTILETQRLILRELCPNDFHEVCKLLQDNEVMYAYEGAFNGTEVREWLDRQIKRYAEDKVGLWGAVLKENGELRRGNRPGNSEKRRNTGGTNL